MVMFTVDVVVCETLGNYPFEENIIATLNDARARFLRPTRFGDNVTVKSTISFGHSSFDVEHQLSLNGETCVECSEKRVWVVRDGSGRLKSHPVPAAVLDKFQG